VARFTLLLTAETITTIQSYQHKIKLTDTRLCAIPVTYHRYAVGKGSLSLEA